MTPEEATAAISRALREPALTPSPLSDVTVEVDMISADGEPDPQVTANRLSAKYGVRITADTATAVITGERYPVEMLLKYEWSMSDRELDTIMASTLPR